VIALRQRAWARRSALAVVVLAVAWFFAGITGLIAAAVGLVVAALLNPRWVAAAAFGSLIIAAVATVLEVQPTGSYDVTFARDRPIASQSALVAGVLAFVAVVAFAIRERTKQERNEVTPSRGEAHGQSSS
jgi:cbb3-type cytochrome oxidase subunit 3